MLALSAALLIFSLQFSLLFFHIYVGRQATPALWRTIGFDAQYRTSDVAENFGCLSNCRYFVDRTQNLPGLALNNVLTVLQISVDPHLF